MRRWLVISVALLASCVDHDASELQHWKQLTCACQSVACAEAMMKFLPPGKSNHRTQAIAHDILECVSKLYAAERPSTNPDDSTARTSGP
jgi:hypothetical protein